MAACAGPGVGRVASWTLAAPAGTRLRSITYEREGKTKVIKVQQAPDGRFVYSWRNPDQGGAAPIAAAHLSDGTVVKGVNVTMLTAATSDLKIYLEDEAGNADPASAVGHTAASIVAVGVHKPILQPAGASARLKITSAKRSGTRLTVKGTIARNVTAKLTVTVARGKTHAKASVKPASGRFSANITLPSALRRKGTNTLSVRFGGQGDFVAATVTKKVTVR